MKLTEDAKLPEGQKKETKKLQWGMIKRHIPAVIGAVSTIVATAFAVHYRNELAEIEDLESNDWPYVKVHPKLMEEIENGRTMRYRQIRRSPDHVYSQMTTQRDGFSDEANERFEKEEKLWEGVSEK